MQTAHIHITLSNMHQCLREPGGSDGRPRATFTVKTLYRGVAPTIPEFPLSLISGEYSNEIQL